MNWSGIDNRSVSGRLLRWPLKLVPRGTILKIRRGPAKGLRWITGSGTHGCWLGTYELEKQECLERFVKPGAVVYDIGAQAGFYTLFFSCLAGAKGLVYAFEPFAENVRNLIAHIQLNRLKNVRIIQAAVGSADGVSGMTVDRSRFMNFIIPLNDAMLVVPTLSLDKAIDTYGFRPPDVIKMDIEGGESSALEGARRTLERYKPALFIALHGIQNSTLVSSLLRELGYSIHALDDGLIKDMAQADEIYALLTNSVRADRRGGLADCGSSL